MVTWNLYENGELIDSFPSHRKAKSAMWKKKVQANFDMLDLYYEVKKIVVKPVKEIPQWKKSGFKSKQEYENWLEEMYEDIRMGVI